MLTFMLKWYEKFPELQSSNLFLTGESYAGHYIPQLATAILDYNAQSSGFKFKIKGVSIGNPLLKLDNVRILLVTRDDLRRDSPNSAPPLAGGSSGGEILRELFGS